MTNESILAQLDPELQSRLTPRRDLFAKAIGMGVKYASVPIAVAVLSNSVFGADLPQDITDVLNFALTLEYLEDAHYKAGLGTKMIPDSDRKVFETISKHESDHVKTLKSVLGGSAVAAPNLDPTAGGAFPDALSNYQTYLALSQAFEDTGVRAYEGQAGNLMSNKKLLTVALQIHSVEARHACEIRRIRQEKGWITGSSRGTLPAATQAIYDGEDNTMQGGKDLAGLPGVPASAITEAFDEPLTKEQVLAIVKPFIKS